MVGKTECLQGRGGQERGPEDSNPHLVASPCHMFLRKHAEESGKNHSINESLAQYSYLKPLALLCCTGPHVKMKSSFFPFEAKP